MEISTIGLDLAKNVFQIHGISATGEVVVRKTLRRSQMVPFFEKLPQLFPHADAKAWFVGNQPMIDATAFRNSSIQGGYFILAARALGLDCGPMSGFDAAKVDAAFWAGTSVKTNFVCNLGRGDASKLFSRSPRLSFEEACRIA